MELKDIFELIVKADEKLKYATTEKADTRAEQARALLERARVEAAAAGSDSLVQQVSQRLSDLDVLQAGGEE